MDYFEFFIVFVKHLNLHTGSYFWLPKKLFFNRSSCSRFIKSYCPKAFEYDSFKILRFVPSDNFLKIIEVKRDVKN